jgi:VCBS repeat-containing protein
MPFANRASAATQSFDFTGYVKATGTQWIIHKMDNANAGALTATLNWGTTSANLNMFLLDANGNTKASASGSNRPETIRFTIPTAGLWKIRVSAASGASNYSVHVDIASGNSAPNAVNDSAAADQNVVETVSPLANDTDPNGDALAIGAVGVPTNGTATKVSDTTISYTPNTDFVGTDSFTYDACDNAAESLCDQATVNVNVTAPRTTNAAPVANNDSASTDKNTNVIINVLGNDTDADGDAMTPVVETNGQHGTATVNPNGAITYAATGWTGTDSFTYYVCDNWTTVACSTAATVTVTVSDVVTGTSGLLLHAPEFMTVNHTVTLEQALQHARDFHVITFADTSLYKKYVPQMKEAAQAAGHSLTLLVYINGTFILKSEVAGITDEAMFMHTKDGKRIVSKDFGNTLSNVFNPAWAQSRINTCNAKMSQAGGVDGCFLDTMGLAPINPTYVTPGVPYNPSTDAPYTGSEWLDGTTSIAQQVRNGLSGKKLFVNGLLNGTYYAQSSAPTKRLIDASDGGMIEIFLRPPNTAVTAYPNETKWKADVDMLAAAAGRSNKPLILTTKVWVPGTQAQYDAWHRYAVASFLMGTSGHEYFNFRLDKNMTTKDVFADVPIGDPAGGYGKVGVYYKRSFTNGVVLVNPTKNAVTVPLDRQYRNLQGQLVSGNFVMAPNTGDVLVNA